MEIRYLGHSSFQIKTKDATLVTDPFPSDKVGIPFPKTSADIVTVSHDHFDHSNIAAVDGQPFIAQTPGEYEVKGVRIYGYPSFHDEKRGAERGKNTIFEIVAEDIHVAHLGDLGHLLEDETLEKLSEIDILLAPVGGVYTIDYEKAVKISSAIEPKIIIPMHYRVEGMAETFKDLTGVGEFMKAMGVESWEEQESLKIVKPNLPLEPQVVVLKRS